MNSHNEISGDTAEYSKQLHQESKKMSCLSGRGLHTLSHVNHSNTSQSGSAVSSCTVWGRGTFSFTGLYVGLASCVLGFVHAWDLAAWDPMLYVVSAVPNGWIPKIPSRYKIYMLVNINACQKNVERNSFWVVFGISNEAAINGRWWDDRSSKKPAAVMATSISLAVENSWVSVN